MRAQQIFFPLLGLTPANVAAPQQARSYGPDIAVAPHTAAGPGLTHATTGTPTYFTIRLAAPAAIRLAAEDNDGNNSGSSTREEEQQHSGGSSGSGGGDGEEGEEPDWDYNLDKKRFIYVWVASRDNVFIAAVENNGDGTLTASYETSFPGDYLVHIEDVNLRIKGDDFGRGRPITGSPFSLTVSGEPAIDVDALPMCGSGSTGNDELEDMESAFWRTGSWVSSNIAAQSHGVLRDGWVFQPKTCAYEAFSHEDILLLAGLEERTWLLAMGNSILRGVFLTLMDMALAEGQKDDFSTSVVKKCWGFIDLHIGNLRLSYQVCLPWEELCVVVVVMVAADVFFLLRFLSHHSSERYSNHTSFGQLLISSGFLAQAGLRPSLWTPI